MRTIADRFLSIVLVMTGLCLNLKESASADDGFSPDVSLILDGHYQSEKGLLSESDKGFGLGHVELSLEAPVDDLFLARFTGVFHQHHQVSEFEIEEAFIQPLALPVGFSLT